jgi:ribonuclease E
MLIDAAHAEETRVVVLAGQALEEFDVETKAKQQIRGNIYLAKVTRVEPSLQACFVDFGSPRHGFLAFSEVHPDYYQIPIADREALIAEEAQHAVDDGGEDDDEAGRARRAQNRKYKIQDVLKRRQIMLVQPVKEVRGNKGAALTTYLSLAGRYCVLMPNTPRGGGISRKITAVGDRKRLKSIVSSLEVPKGMGLIIRTAGAKRNKTEIKRDYEYLLRLWDDIRNRTLESVAPALIHEEESLVKRAIRDLYNKDVGSIVIEGEAAYREAKDFVKMLIPSHARKVHQYKHSKPLFARMGVDALLSNIHSGVVQLKSGGYIVINQTEALVAVDVNSGKSTRERSIEQTALKTNLEAAEEVARQMRLRDLAGLIVIDFIDMDEPRNDRAVERKVKDALRLDRARVQMGKISSFGLMEISRQRRRTGILEGSSHVCPSCQGFGRVRSPSSIATSVIREIEAMCGGRQNCEIEVRTDGQTAMYLLNEKRKHLASLEINRHIFIRIISSSEIAQSNYEIEIINHGEEIDEPEFNFAYLREIDAQIDDLDIDEETIIEDDEPDTETDIEAEKSVNPRNKRRRPRRRGRRGENRDIENRDIESENSSNDGEIIASNDETSQEVALETTENAAKNDEQQPRSRRKRNRLFGRNRRDRVRDDSTNDTNNSQNLESEAQTEIQINAETTIAAIDDSAFVQINSETAENSQDLVVSETKKPTKRPRGRKPAREKAVAETENTKANSDVSVVEDTPIATQTIEPIIEVSDIQKSELSKDEPQSEPKKQGHRKTGWWARNASKLFGTEDGQE